jgi:hypothetical protein
MFQLLPVRGPTVQLKGQRGVRRLPCRSAINTPASVTAPPHTVEISVIHNVNLWSPVITG